MQFEQIRARDGSATVTVYVDDLDFAKSMPHDHPNYQKVMALLTEYEQRDDRGAALTAEENQGLVDLWNVQDALNAKLDRLSDRYVVKAGVLYKDGDPMDKDDPWVKQVLRFRDEDVLDWAPLIRFQDKLDANPNEHSRAQLYRFLSLYPITITDDGDLVLYKGAVHRDGDAEDFDAYPFQSVNGGPDTIVDDEEQPSGQIKQGIGSVVEHPRSLVHFDPARACSNGLHCGTYSYARGFSSMVVLRVIVNPRDVVNVPSHDHKVRVCRYVVDSIAENGEYKEAVLVQQKVIVDGPSAVTNIQDPSKAPYVPAEATYDGQEGEDTPEAPEALSVDESDHALTCSGCNDCLDTDDESDFYCYGCETTHAGSCEDPTDPPEDKPVNDQEVTPVTTAAPKAARKRYPSPKAWAELIERKTRRRKSIRALAPENWALTGDDPNERKSWEVGPKA